MNITIHSIEPLGESVRDEAARSLFSKCGALVRKID